MTNLITNVVVSVDYLSNQTFRSYEAIKNETFFGITSQECYLINNYYYDCWRIDYFSGILTILLLYLPSTYFISALFGPSKTKEFAKIWNPVFWGVGSIIFGILFSDEGESARTVVYFLLGFGILIVLMIGLYSIPYISTWTCRNFNSTFLYPILLLISPLIYIYIKLMLSIKSNENELILHQNRYASFGKTLFGSTPLFCIHLYNMLSQRTDFSISQVFTLIFTPIGISLAINRRFFNYKNNSADFTSTFSFITFIVILLNTTGRLISFSLMTLFFDTETLAIIFSYCVALLLLLIYSFGLYSKNKKKNELTHELEGIVLSFVVQTNIEGTKSAKLFRFMIFYFITVFYLGTTTLLLSLCNINPENISYGDIIWSEIPIVKNIYVLNMVCGIALIFLVFSLILDILLQLFTGKSFFHADCREVFKPT